MAMNPDADAPSRRPSPWRHATWMTLAAFVLGLSVEILFDRRPMGISALVWAFLSVAALLLVGAFEGVRPSLDTLAFIPGILLFAAFLFLRTEPMTTFLSLVSLLALFALWVRVYRTGGLWRHGWLDLGLALIWVPLESWGRTWGPLSDTWLHIAGERGQRSKLVAILRGLLLAIPILIVLGSLLSAADLVFSDYLRTVLAWLGLDRLVELAGRAGVVVLSGLFFLGVLAVAVLPREGRKLIGEERPLIRPFLGFTESAVILAAVNLLFAAFVAVQFAYLFGGEANITATGYTYSEYARRGFGELVAVSVLTLGLILGLGEWAMREDGRQRAWFHGLSVLLVGLVGVILGSALMRLSLYENAYGFTRLRTYTHVAIFWMGAVFLTFLVLLLARRLRAFAPAVGVGFAGFVVTLGLINVDAFIVRENVGRLQETGKVDVAYLASLSSDAVPGLVRLAGEADPATRLELLPALACRLGQLESRAAETGLPSFHLSYTAALESLRGMEDDLAPYPVRWQPYSEGSRWGQWFVTVEGTEQTCRAEMEGF
jgi:CBS domain-containing protein